MSKRFVDPKKNGLKLSLQIFSVDSYMCRKIDTHKTVRQVDWEADRQVNK